jgi:hypothetical protein
MRVLLTNGTRSVVFTVAGRVGDAVPQAMWARRSGNGAAVWSVELSTTDVRAAEVPDSARRRA